jgi:HD-GYP domain-containing protein (c-di-GMP phosphodiesterase class II)
LAVADVFDALRAKRPYRDALPLDKVFSIMRNDTPHALDAACLAALMECKKELQGTHTAAPVQIAVPRVLTSPIQTTKLS